MLQPPVNVRALKNKDSILEGIAAQNRKARKRENRMCIGDKAIVFLRFDDGNVESYSKVYPVLIANNLVGSFFCISSRIILADAGNAVYFTTANGNTMVGRGMEMCSHSYNHYEDSPNGSTEEKIEIVDSKTFLESKGWRIESFGMPGGWTGDHALATDALWDSTRVGKLIQSTYLTSGNNPHKMSGQFPNLIRYGRGYSSEGVNTVANIEARIDTTIANKGMINFLWHPWQLDTAGYHTTAEFTTIMEYIKAKRDAGLLEVLTYTGSAFATKTGGVWDDILQDGDFERLDTDFWGAWYKTGSPTLGTDSGKYVIVKQSNAVLQDVNIVGTDWPGAQVLLRAMVRRASGGASSPRATIHINGTELWHQAISGTSDSAFGRYERCFTVPLTATAVKITLDTEGAGEAYWDDVHLYRL
jgi:peptidoglycan/xylan/chitin deacetylase (PgdA/CDA1 family)